ncbi:MAG: helix-turn-helix domain-containing protein [Acidithiobacillus sp.]|uniref:helix-turn-helix domain-containing protein n=1 Tax=Acidithiobacillus sp. TaxID=1872118 RepID=UPI0025C48DA1|nr:helix-turn-helix domain-containing protein [Acidithiobacillus sp.]
MTRPSLHDCVRAAVADYLDDLHEEAPLALHERVLGEVERALLQTVMERAEGRRIVAAAWLGINRNTLSKKLQRYGLDN